jgi:hypothetical protein
LNEQFGVVAPAGGVVGQRVIMSGSRGGVCPEIPKISLIDLSLECSIGKLYSFAGLGVVYKDFSGRSRPENSEGE